MKIDKFAFPVIIIAVFIAFLVIAMMFGLLPMLGGKHGGHSELQLFESCINLQGQLA